MLKFALSLLLLSTFSSAADSPRTIAVAGHGTVFVAPDEVRLSYDFIDEDRLPRGQQTPAGLVAKLVERNKRRAAPALDYIKGVVGSDGIVEALPSVRREYEYDNALSRQRLVGYRATTDVSVLLRGRPAIEKRLPSLLDAAKLEADEVAEPVPALEDATRAAAEREAAKTALTDALAAAQSELEEGEHLGAILQRSERVEQPGPMPKMFAARAMAGMAAPESAQPVVETGKVPVETTIHFVFEVLGTPTRLEKR